MSPAPERVYPRIKLSRASTSSLSLEQERRDGRDEPGHDEKGFSLSGGGHDHRFAFGGEHHIQAAGLRQQPRIIRLHRMGIDRSVADAELSMSAIFCGMRALSPAAATRKPMASPSPT